MPSLEEIKSQLHSALTAAKTAGAKIIFGSYGDGFRSCCAISALSHVTGDRITGAYTGAGVLNITLLQAKAIAYGFDGADHVLRDEELAVDPNFFSIGKALREEFQPEKLIFDKSL